MLDPSPRCEAIIFTSLKIAAGRIRTPWQDYDDFDLALTENRALLSPSLKRILRRKLIDAQAVYFLSACLLCNPITT
jgi:hypothetical protein